MRKLIEGIKAAPYLILLVFLVLMPECKDERHQKMMAKEKNTQSFVGDGDHEEMLLAFIKIITATMVVVLILICLVLVYFLLISSTKPPLG